MGNCLQPLMASTIFDVPALDVALAVSTGLRTPKLPIRAGSVNRQCMLLIGYGACKNCWPELHCILNWDITHHQSWGVCVVSMTIQTVKTLPRQKRLLEVVIQPLRTV